MKADQKNIFVEAGNNTSYLRMVRYAMNGLFVGPAGAQSIVAFRQDLAYVRAYIQQHYAEELTVKGLAEQISMSPNHLGRAFLKAEGVSVREYIENVRLERAAALLRGTEGSISGIAHKTGFANAAYFSSRFHAAFGVTPRDYRWRSRQAAEVGQGRTQEE